MQSAHGFNYQKYVVVVQYHVYIVYDAVSERMVGKLSLVENVFYIQFFAVKARSELFRVSENNFGNARADYSETEDCDIYHK